MFDRKKYKSFAKRMLKGRWGVPVFMTIVMMLVVSIFTIPDCIRFINSEDGQAVLYGSFNNITELYSTFMNASNKATSTVTTLIQSIVQAILEVAALSVFIQMSRSPNKVKFSQFIEGLNNWWRATLACIWQTIWVTIWSFLFIIPGLIKYISYSQMFYIITEFEDVSITKAMRISMIITKGYKMDLFIMALSFIGWDILAILSCGIGFLWLIPYQRMTYINAYHFLMKTALEEGKIKPEDLK